MSELALTITPETAADEVAIERLHERIGGGVKMFHGETTGDERPAAMGSARRAFFLTLSGNPQRVGGVGAWINPAVANSIASAIRPDSSVFT